MTFEGVGANPLATPVHAKTYANPVINFSLPDPTIIKGDDEYYYLYATESIKNVPIHRSRDLVNWHYVGTALQMLPVQTSNLKGEYGHRILIKSVINT